MPIISLIIPIYNEAKHLKAYLLRQITGLEKHGLSYEVILSENGSTDDTKQLACDLVRNYPRLRLLTATEANYGQAVKAGFKKATGRYLLLFDLDYFDFTFLKHSLPLLDHFDAVIGSKNLKTSQDRRHLIRRLGSQLFTIILKILFGYRLHDTHGIKILNRQKFLPLIKQTKFTREIFDTELLIRAQIAGLKLTEIPVTVKELRKSRTSILKRLLKTIPDLLKLKLDLISYLS